MSLSDKAHAHRIALRELEREMRGINPVTSTYKNLEEKKKKLLFELEQLGAKRTDQAKI